MFSQLIKSPGATMSSQFLGSSQFIMSRGGGGSAPDPVATILAQATGLYYPANAEAADRGMVNENDGVAIASAANGMRFPNGYAARPQSAPNLVLPNGATLTFDYSDGPVAGQRALRAQGSSLPGKANRTDFYIPAGTYTLAWEGKAAAAVSVKAGISTNRVSYAYTTEWQTFTHTFTSTGAAITLDFTYYDGAAFDVEIANLRISVGASDLGLDASLPFLWEYNTATATPALSTPEWRADGLLQRQEVVSVTGFSAVWSMDCGASAIPSTAFLWQVSDNGYQDLSIYMTATALATNRNGSPEPGASFTTAGIGRTTFAVSITADLLVVLRNSCPILIRDLSPAFTPVESSFISTAARTGLPSDWALGAFGFWDEGLGTAALAAATKGIENAVIASGLAIEDSNAAYYALGDSITVGNDIDPIYSYADQSLNDTGAAGGFGRNLAVGGYSLALISTVIDLWLPYWSAAADNGKTPVISLMCGYNDADAYFIPDPAGYYNLVMAQVARLRSAGCAVIMCDTLPSTKAGLNTARATYNGLLAAGVGTDFDYHCDFSGTTTGTDAAASNLTYYGDGIHPTQAGQDELYPVFNAVLATALAA